MTCGHVVITLIIYSEVDVTMVTCSRLYVVMPMTMYSHVVMMVLSLWIPDIGACIAFYCHMSVVCWAGSVSLSLWLCIKSYLIEANIDIQSSLLLTLLC